MTNNLTPQEEKQLLEMLKNQPRDIRSLNIYCKSFIGIGWILSSWNSVLFTQTSYRQRSILCGSTKFRRRDDINC